MEKTAAALFRRVPGGGDLDIRIKQAEEIHLVGYKGNTNRGFYIIPRLWSRLYGAKHRIPNRIHTDFVTGVNVYTGDFPRTSSSPAFAYYAAVEVSEIAYTDPKMSSLTLPAGKYAVFSYMGRSQDSLAPVMEYIYKEWLPQSGVRINPEYDFARYSESIDERNQSIIEIWLPLL